MAKDNIVDQVSALAALGNAVIDAVKASGLMRAKRRSRRPVELEQPARAKARRNPLRGARPAQPTE